jgi:DNA-binding response OmpR family regulator
MTKILLVEDDKELAGTVREWLTFEKHDVEVVHDGEDAWQHLQTYTYDVVILDWELPSKSGLEICRAFRLGGGATPVLFLTGRTAIPERESGLDAGADDYLCKPFHVKELCARVRALLRRPNVVPKTVFAIGDISLDVNTRRVHKAGEDVRLQPKEFAVLEYLMRHPNQVFSTRALMDAVWTAEREASEDTVRTCVKTLRRKISGQGDQCIIQTVHGLGYKVESD